MGHEYKIWVKYQCNSGCIVNKCCDVTLEFTVSVRRKTPYSLFSFKHLVYQWDLFINLFFIFCFFCLTVEHSSSDSVEEKTVTFLEICKCICLVQMHYITVIFFCVNFPCIHWHCIWGSIYPLYSTVQACEYNTINRDIFLWKHITKGMKKWQILSPSTYKHFLLSPA